MHLDYDRPDCSFSLVQLALIIVSSLIRRLSKATERSESNEDVAINLPQSQMIGLHS